MSLVQIYIKVPKTPVLILCVADKCSILLQNCQQVSCLQMLPQETPECHSTSEKEKNDRPYSAAHPACDPQCQLIQQHKKSQQGSDTEQIIGQVQPQSQILQISSQELKHKMILHIRSSEMRILGREIISQGKGSHHGSMGCIIATYCQPCIHHSVFNIKHIKHHICNKDQQDSEKYQFFPETAPVSDHGFRLHGLCFLFPSV